MEEHPSPASHGLILDRFVKKPVQISTKEDPLNFSPKSPFTWVEATVKAAAEQKPEMTGAEMKSTINPIHVSQEINRYYFCVFPQVCCDIISSLSGR